MTATLAQLTAAATGGRRFVRKQLMSASLVYQLTQDPFWVWCNYHAPPDQAVDETSRFERFRMECGSEFGRKLVHEKFPEALEIGRPWEFQSLRETLTAMIEGVPVISEAVLWDLEGETFGAADLLVRRDDAPSLLGPFHYRVGEIKRSRNLQGYHKLQAAIYNQMLGKIQGFLPPEIDFYLPDGMTTVAHAEVVTQLDEALGLWRSIRDGKLKPEVGGLGDTGSPWGVYADRLLRDSKDVVLLPDIGPKGRSKFREAFGTTCIEDLYAVSEPDLCAQFGDKGRWIFKCIEAYRLNRPVLLNDTLPEIPRRRRSLYFDFETCFDTKPGIPAHVYMVGVYDSSTGNYRVFTARGASEEARMFTDFLDWVGDPDEVFLYHWSNFESRTILNEVIPRIPAITDRLNKLVGSCIDLKEVIKPQVCFPVPTYSIKSVAPVAGFKWKQADVDAFESMMLYWEFLEDGDQAKMDRIIQYNRDDCEAMAKVDRHVCDLI